MRKHLLLLAGIFWLAIAHAQLTGLPSGGNKKAWTGERIGLTDVTIEYSRPAVKGREGHIWGELVHTGFQDLGFGSSKRAPWRAGANENTTIRFSHDVKVEGKPVAAGTYGLFIAWDAKEPLLILSRNHTSWGSYFYDEGEDVLRAKLKALPLEQPVEWLRFEFLNQKEASATIALEWEKIRIPFTVETDYVQQQLESFRRELRSEKGFNPGWQSYNQAARFTLDRNTNLEEGLRWIETGISDPFFGQANFSTLSTKAAILARLGRNREADSLMKAALPMGTMQEVHNYGRQLIQQKRGKEALPVFKMNHDKHPGEFTTLMGLTRGYSAAGDYKNALKYANLALPKAPNGPNKDFLLAAIEKLKKGMDIN